MTHTHLRRYNDQIHCSACNLTWDANDPNPPECKPVPPPSVGHKVVYEPPVKQQRPTAPVKKGKPITSNHWALLKEAMETNDFSKLL